MTTTARITTTPKTTPQRVIPPRMARSFRTTAFRPGFLAAAASIGMLMLLATPALADTAAESADGWGAGNTQGFIYGEIATDRDTYRGRIRWNGDEEAFWGDIFNGSKDDMPYADEIPRRELTRRRSGDGFWRRFASRWDDRRHSRSTTVRFGDIEEIEVLSGDRALLYLKSGTELEVDGGSNDLGADITIWDESVGRVTIDWDRVETVRFLPTPRNLDVGAYRLKGRVETRAGIFEGYVQWDLEECLSHDELDGDTRDGDLAIPMGKIRSIERRSRASSLVTLKDGRELVLDGSNDVNSSNRGIFVEDPRFGRVKVSWESFERVTFEDEPDSGPAFDEFAPGSPLRGAVTDIDGTRRSGRMVFDIDESETWESLDGSYRDVEYSIPFALVRSIEPRSADASRIELVDGETLELEDSADVGDENAGVLVLADGGGTTYIPWRDVDRIEIDPAN